MSGLWALWCNLVRRVLFISEESIAGGATPKYTTRPRVLRGTGKGSFMETGGRGREEGGNKGKAKVGNIMDSITHTHYLVVCSVLTID